MGTIIRGTALSLQGIARLASDGGSLLDGRTTDSNVPVGLATSNLEPFTGTRWLARPDPSAPSNSNQIVLECLGHIDGPRFLDGRTEDGTVGLAPNTNPQFSGTHWAVIDDGADQVSLQCLGASTKGKNARFLHANLLNHTVGLVAQQGGPLDGAHWIVLDAQPQPKGGPGVTSAASKSGPSLIYRAAGIGGAPFVGMAWSAADQDPRNDGRISIMADVLGSPFTVSLANKCIDGPALAANQPGGKIFLAWTAPDQSINVMSSDDGLVFSGRVQLPGKSRFGPAITAGHGVPIVAWADAANGELKIMKNLSGPVVSTGETCSAAPALTFIPELGDSVVVAWTGTSAQRTLNVAVWDFATVPHIGQKVTLPDSGSGAAASIAGPSIAYKAAFQAASLMMGWVGLPGGNDHDNHLNVIFSGNFQIFASRETFRPVTSLAPAVLDITRSADDKVFFAWVDRQSRRIVTASSHTPDLPTIPA